MHWLCSLRSIPLARNQHGFTAQKHTYCTLNSMLFTNKSDKSRHAANSDKHNKLCINNLQSHLILSVFATRHLVGRKFFKYEEVRCQENSHKSFSEIACAMMRINTLFDYSSNSTPAHVMGLMQFHFLQNGYFLQQISLKFILLFYLCTLILKK